MKKPNTAVYIALAIVIIGLIFQVMEMGVFGKDPIPEITKYNQLFFWTGIAVWALGYIKQEDKKRRIAKMTCELNNNLNGLLVMNYHFKTNEPFAILF